MKITSIVPWLVAVAGLLRQLSELLVGDDPTRIEQIWHKTFRAFAYMGSRGAKALDGFDGRGIRPDAIGMPNLRPNRK